MTQSTGRQHDHSLDPTLLPSSEPRVSTDIRFVTPVLKAIVTAVEQGSALAAQTCAGRMYTRKGEELVTVFGDSPNQAYDRGDGDFYLQIGVRVASSVGSPAQEAIQTVEAISKEQQLVKAQLKLDKAKEQTRAAQEAEALIQAEIARLTGTT